MPDTELRFQALIDSLYITGADIILLTEIWSEKHATRLCQKFHTVWPYAVTSYSNSWIFMGSGLLLLSKIPLVSGSFLPYTKQGGFDSLAEKGLLLAKFENGLVILGTHIQANYVDKNYDTIQDSQIAQLTEAAKQYCADIVFGDFNCFQDTAQFKTLQDSLKECRGLTCHNPQPKEGYKTRAYDKHHSEIKDAMKDYIFAKNVKWIVNDPLSDHEYFGGGEYWYTDKGEVRRDISDHLPLFAKVEFESK